MNMIEGYNAVTQALLGTLLTWGLTALGASLVIFLRGNHVSALLMPHDLYKLSKFCHFREKHWMFRLDLVLV